MQVHASTQEKDLIIENLTGPIVARNHQGDVTIKAVKNNLEVHAHHGNIDVQFDKNPVAYLRCGTHHGDIKIHLQKDLSADISMKSHHGAFYTDFDYQPVVNQVSRKEVSDHDGTKYQIGNGTNIRIGGGAIKMDFKTHHGDVYLTSK
jgi:hypothetical protein